MFEWTKDFKKYKSMMYLLFVVGLISIISSILLKMESASGLLMGFGSSLVLISGINIATVYIKNKKDAQYEEEMNLEFVDERLKNNKLKVLAYSGIVGMCSLALSNVIHLLLETNLLISNVVVIFSYTLVLLGLKLFYKNR